MLFFVGFFFFSIPFLLSSFVFLAIIFLYIIYYICVCSLPFVQNYLPIYSFVFRFLFSFSNYINYFHVICIFFLTTCFVSVVVVVVVVLYTHVQRGISNQKKNTHMTPASRGRHIRQSDRRHPCQPHK